MKFTAPAGVADMGEDRHDESPGVWKDAAERFSDGVRQTVEFQKKLIRRDTTPSDLTAGYTRFLRSDLAGYGQRIAELTVDYYKALAEAAREYGDRFWEEMQSSADSEDRAQSDERPRHVLEVSGAAGSEVTSTFTLENTDPDAAEVSIEAGLCRGPDGEAFSAPLAVEPDKLTIEPGGSATVTITTRVDPELFTPEVDYRVPVHVEGPQPAVIDVRVRSTAPEQEAKPTKFTVRCPKCDRTFERKTEDRRLRPHKAPSGKPCAERSGVPG